MLDINLHLDSYANETLICINCGYVRYKHGNLRSVNGHIYVLIVAMLDINTEHP